MADKDRLISCGVLITDAVGYVLLGKATGTRRWDIPKGLVEPGEAWSEAASRELEEETSLSVLAADLHPVGKFDYLPTKDLVLFTWRPSMPIDPAKLYCRSIFTARDGRQLPELERFAFSPWDKVLEQVGKNMARVLASLDSSTLSLSSSNRAP